MRMILVLVVLAFAAPALALPDPECLARKKTEPKLICMDSTPVPTPVPTAIQLVVPRNGEAKKDIEKAADHLDDAATRGR